ncbi:hypothetical protein LTR22_026586 [Elasticomyces elasticus]|nr:hypothetical protein LTR22_026586 [Elasticomyces elasticus]KAK4901961.1 hypothetical protein LTR49_027127 [Elasticomyces elasticus]KAK5736488.1 hypothetical protein LTS12_026163 [Elasticomyces elasticus]
MGWQSFNNRPLPFPLRSRDFNFPDPAYYRRRSRSRSRRREDEWEKSVAALRDKTVRDRVGDLGWVLEYATAWLYRHLVHNRPGVADAIDRIRAAVGVEGVQEDSPFLIFEHLNKVLFAGKLRGMVYLRLKASASNTPGTTSAAGVVPGIDRICVELNSTLFEDDEGDVDELLDVMIHQMIHAYLLVTCGAQKKGSQQDGRLLDGLHLGVIMYTIKDITQQCKLDELDLTFHAASRQARNGNPFAPRQLPKRNNFIALSNKGSPMAAPPADGHSHCHLDNRAVRLPMIKNWQVEGYSVALDLDMESKGDTIYDLTVYKQFDPVDRLKAPPSSTYIELIWDKKRVMVKRDHISKYKSIKKPLEKNNKMELAVPECDEKVFHRIYDFFNRGKYDDGKSSSGWAERLHPSTRQGPPILLCHEENNPRVNDLLLDDSPWDIVAHLQTFKAAESMKFEELQAYVLQVLWDLNKTDSDPIDALKVLYNENDNSGPVHAELHKWAREFLGRVDNSPDERRGDRWRDRDHAGRGRRLSNLEKIYESHHRERFQQLYVRNMALQDDVRLVAMELRQRQDRYDSPRDWRSLPGNRRPLELPGDMSLNIQDVEHHIRNIRIGHKPRERLADREFWSPFSSTESLGIRDTPFDRRARADWEDRHSQIRSIEAGPRLRSLPGLERDDFDFDFGKRRQRDREFVRDDFEFGF